LIDGRYRQREIEIDIQEIMRLAAASLSVPDGRPYHLSDSPHHMLKGIKNVTASMSRFSRGIFPGQADFSRCTDPLEGLAQTGGCMAFLFGSGNDR
jgi:hypothetical protein